MPSGLTRREDPVNVHKNAKPACCLSAIRIS